MNYEIYCDLEAGRIRQSAEESDQAYWERILQAVVDGEDPKGTPSFNKLLAPIFIGCSASGQSLTLRFIPKDEETNPNGNLHGGVIAAMIDVSMGVLSRFLLGSNRIVTAQMGIDYLRSIPMDHAVEVTAYSVKSGRRVQFTRAEVRDTVTGKPAAAGTGMYM